MRTDFDLEADMIERRPLNARAVEVGNFPRMTANTTLPSDKYGLHRRPVFPTR